MNTMIKIILPVVVYGFCVVGLHAQAPLPCEQREQPHCGYAVQHPVQGDRTFDGLPAESFRTKTASFRDGIIKPYHAIVYNPRTGYFAENPIEKWDYFYDTKGKLVKEITELLVSNEVRVTSYSSRFPSHSYDYVDTSTLYKSAGMEPVDRFYFEYGIEDAEAPYITRISQRWNRSKARWDNLGKTSYFYLDTVTWYVAVAEYYQVNSDNSFRLRSREDYSLISCDENNNVSQQVVRITRPDEGISDQPVIRVLCYYPAGSHDDNTGYDSIYQESYNPGSDTWHPYAKNTDVVWHRWDGIFYDSNQRESFYGWYPDEQEEYVLAGRERYWYDVDGVSGSWIDSIYAYSHLYQCWYTLAVESQTYTEQGDLCTDKAFSWYYLEQTEGVPVLNLYIIDSFANEYNSDGLLWRYSNYFTHSDISSDPLLFLIWEVTEFVDVTGIPGLPPADRQSLAVFPNPASGAVNVSAAGGMRQLSIFDITGRPIKTMLLSDSQAVFDTGGLPQGVYMVRALLKNGAVQTGKLVVR